MTVSLLTLFLILLLLIVLSAFFSSSETALMSLDKHRLNHLCEQGNRGALRVSKLLENTNHLIGLILLGNNFVNIMASALTTVIALRLGGELYVAFATGILTFVILVFAEIAPKTFAVKNPEKLAFPFSLVLLPLLKVALPLVLFVNSFATLFLWLIGQSKTTSNHSIDTNTLKTIVEKSGQAIPKNHQEMIIGMLELSDVQIEEIMIPKNDIVGLDIRDSRENLILLLTNLTYTRLPVFDGNINQIRGVLHMRDALRLINNENLSINKILEASQEPYIIPETTSLLSQLQNFREQKQRLAFIVDEYGNIRGLTTLDDILEEIVGDFTSDIADVSPGIIKKAPNLWQIEATVPLREINEACETNLEAEDATTLNGLILEILGEVPNAPMSIPFQECFINVLKFNENSILMAELHHTQPQSEKDE